jgi:small multidrug resistance family-3 protein
LALFFVAAIAEIGGGYMVWLWWREKKTIALGVLGGIILFVYGIIPTLHQPNLEGYMQHTEVFS